MAITILSVVLLVLGLVGMTGTVTWVLMRGNNTRLTRLFVTCQCSVMVWLISQLMILFSVTHKQLWFSYIIGNIGISTFAPFWLMFSFEYADVRTWLKKAGIALPVISAAAVLREDVLHFSDTVLCIYSCGDMCHIYQALPRRYKNDASVNASCTCNGCSAVYKYIERNSSYRDKDRKRQ